jgi:hypothetical protein
MHKDFLFPMGQDRALPWKKIAAPTTASHVSRKNAFLAALVLQSIIALGITPASCSVAG